MKAKLSDYLAAALRGERVVIARRNVPPVAELKPIAAPPATPRPLGQGLREEGYELPEEFWEPLPDELTTAFCGRTGTQGQDPAR